MSSTCAQSGWLGDEQFWSGFSKDLACRRVPFSGSLALTHSCNLRCLHCYVQGEPAAGEAATELRTGQWLRIIEEIKEAGCLSLLLTGGDPLLREDFPEIYSFIKKNGFLVTVFTSGSLVSDRIVDLFAELPPRLVEITLYGAGASTHDLVTGVPGSFARSIQGIERLLARGVHVGLKSVLMTLNQDEFPALEELAKGFGVRFRSDAAIFPTLAGDHGPVGLRVAPDRAVALEMADPERRREWREFFKNSPSIPQGKQIFVCNAGLTTFHIDPDGRLFPCLMARMVEYPLASGDFMEGWSEMARVRQLEAEGDFSCGGCEKKTICGFCPGFFMLENGQSQAPSDYVCAIGRLRHEYIMNET